jgi:hypothetical protein
MRYVRTASEGLYHSTVTNVSWHQVTCRVVGARAFVATASSDRTSPYIVILPPLSPLSSSFQQQLEHRQQKAQQGQVVPSYPAADVHHCLQPAANSPPCRSAYQTLPPFQPRTSPTSRLWWCHRRPQSATTPGCLLPPAILFEPAGIGSPNPPKPNPIPNPKP